MVTCPQIAATGASPARTVSTRSLAVASGEERVRVVGRGLTLTLDTRGSQAAGWQQRPGGHDYMRTRYAAARPQRHAEEDVRKAFPADSSLLRVKGLRTARTHKEIVSRWQRRAGGKRSNGSEEMWRGVDPGRPVALRR